MKLKTANYVQKRVARAALRVRQMRKLRSMLARKEFIAVILDLQQQQEMHSKKILISTGLLFPELNYLEK